MSDESSLEQIRRYWDDAAAIFDNEPDHGLRDPVIRDAWAEQLRKWLPSPPTTVLDTGCGTGSLSVLLSGFGHKVTGVDLSPAMIAEAQAKAATVPSTNPIHFQVMDASYPQFAPQAFDVVLCRHLLWALPEPAQVVRLWIDLLKPGGRLVLIEGFWYTDVGLHATEIVEMLPTSLTDVAVYSLSEYAELWGGKKTDERYAVIAMLTARE